MTTLIGVPMKGLADSKTRLAPGIAPGSRAQLAFGLFERTQSFFATEFPSFERLVVTPSRSIAAGASDLGAHVLLEPRQEGLDVAAARCMSWAQARGFRRLLMVPADIPVWLRQEVHALLAEGRENDVVIARAHDNGTNALLFNLERVSAFDFRYGDASASRHEEACRRAQLTHRTCCLPFMSRDVDTLHDYMNLSPSLRQG